MECLNAPEARRQSNEYISKCSCFYKPACPYTSSPLLPVGPQMHRWSPLQLHSAWARWERINKALQCIGVTKLAVFHNKVFQSSQLETIKRAIHHRCEAESLRGGSADRGADEPARCSLTELIYTELWRVQTMEHCQRFSNKPLTWKQGMMGAGWSRAGFCLVTWGFLHSSPIRGPHAPSPPPTTTSH